MNKENTDKLVDKYPQLYRQYQLNSPQRTSMYWGFQCSDGWYKLIDELSKQLTKISKNIEATCIKEKFGTLRFYFYGTDTVKQLNKAHKLIAKYEYKSGITCEDCGKPGKLRKHNGWFTTLCTKHYKEWKGEDK